MQPLALLVEHVLLLVEQALDREAIHRQVRRSASIQPRTVSSGIASSSGLNQELACCWRANRICTCCRRALMLVVALILVVLQRRRKYQTR